MELSGGAVELARYIRIPGFLSKDDNSHVTDYAIRRQRDFVESKLDMSAPNYRRSKILPTFRDIGMVLEQRLSEILPEALGYLGLAAPERPAFETQLTTHNDGGYLKIHNDNGSPLTSSRVLSYVYYFHREPPAFRGGQIRIYDSQVVSNFWVAADTFVDLQPENNMMLLFPSRLLHEVLPISCPSRRFADGRFTLNGWVRAQGTSASGPATPAPR